ncbi:MAG: erythromycin biosynthesis sensory transduction protein eryC1 [Thermoplasmata archaeon]|nr:MAG: erythromycin biosynthesis sensory transduction protein eryC1 [Thermoplasmata archaeon]
MKVELNRMFVNDRIKESVLSVLESGRYVKGPMAAEMERKFASMMGSPFAVSCSSGSTALMLAFRALGLGPGDEVLMPSHTFVASLNGFYHYGARPVFVDVDPETMTMDPEKASDAVTDSTKAVLPVHIYGHPADMGAFVDLAEDREIALIGDAAQAHGAAYRGTDVGAIGDMTCYSFFPSKIVTVGGEGGMITCEDEELYLNLQALKNHGRYEGERDISSMPGFNFRLPEILASIGIVQLEHMESWIERRRKIAKRYSRELEGVGDTRVPVERDWARHVYYLYVIRTSRRDELRTHLKNRGISTGIHYRVPVHRMPYIEGRWELPETESLVNEILSLPMHPLLTPEEQDAVIEAVLDFFRSS